MGTHAAGLVPRAMFSLLRCLFDFKASLTLSKLYVGGMGIGRWEIGDSTFHAHPEFQGAGQEAGSFCPRTMQIEFNWSAPAAKNAPRAFGKPYAAASAPASLIQ